MIVNVVCRLCVPNKKGRVELRSRIEETGEMSHRGSARGQRRREINPSVFTENDIEMMVLFCREVVRRFSFVSNPAHLQHNVVRRAVYSFAFLNWYLDHELHRWFDEDILEMEQIYRRHTWSVARVADTAEGDYVVPSRLPGLVPTLDLSVYTRESVETMVWFVTTVTTVNLRDAAIQNMDIRKKHVAIRTIAHVNRYLDQTAEQLQPDLHSVQLVPNNVQAYRNTWRNGLVTV